MFTFYLNSVTRWLHYLLNFCPITTMKIIPFTNQFAQAVSKFCPWLNKPSNKCQWPFKCCQSVKISTNLVTMIVSTCGGCPLEAVVWGGWWWWWRLLRWRAGWGRSGGSERCRWCCTTIPAAEDRFLDLRHKQVWCSRIRGRICKNEMDQNSWHFIINFNKIKKEF